MMVRDTTSWSWENHRWTGGGFAAPGVHEEVRRHLIEPEGLIYFAGEHISQHHAWMQGALESALLAVRGILTAGNH